MVALPRIFGRGKPSFVHERFEPGDVITSAYSWPGPFPQYYLVLPTEDSPVPRLHDGEILCLRNLSYGNSGGSIGTYRELDRAGQPQYRKIAPEDAITEISLAANEYIRAIRFANDTETDSIRNASSRVISALEKLK